MIPAAVLANTKTTALQIENLGYSYPKVKKPALMDFSLKLAQGEIFGLLGPNGSGKTTLFRILSTEFAALQGTAKIFGADLQDQAHAVRKTIGVVFQHPGLDKKLTIAENWRHQGHLYGLWGIRLTRRMDEAAQILGLTQRRNQLVGQLSGGLARRAEIAKALLHEPKLLIMDEPSTGLDPGARLDLWQHIKELREQKKTTVLLTTHLIEEADRCDRIGILNEGKLVALGAPQTLKSEIGGDIIRIETQEPKTLAQDIAHKYNCRISLSEAPGAASSASGRLRLMQDCLHIERPDGHEFIPQLIAAFPGRIEAIHFSKPTLEDVFIKRTGRAFTLKDTP